MHIQDPFIPLVCKFLLKSVNNQMIGHTASSGLVKNLLKISLKTRGHRMLFPPLQKTLRASELLQSVWKVFET